MKTNNILTHKINNLFSNEQTKNEAIDILNTYGTESSERESIRVRLAILKLVGTNPIISEIQKYTKIAKEDYRDILSWAEYPRQSKHWSLPEGLKKEKMVHADKQEYESWLNI